MSLRPIRSTREGLPWQLTVPSLLFGVVLSVAMAWGFEYRAKPSAIAMTSVTLDGTSAPKPFVTYMGSDDTFGTDAVGLVFVDLAGPVPRDHINAKLAEVMLLVDDVEQRLVIPSWMPQKFSVNETRVYRAMGWPWLCLMGSCDETGKSRGGFATGQATRFGYRVLGYTPIWPGLIGNTLLYGTSVAGLIIATRVSRRALRRRAGRCPDCGYDLAGTTGQPCPECGGTAAFKERPSGRAVADDLGGGA